jgi:hypothetical protein
MNKKTEKNPKGAGRQKLGNKLYQRRISPELFKKMDELLKKLKNE